MPRCDPGKKKRVFFFFCFSPIFIYPKMHLLITIYIFIYMPIICGSEPVMWGIFFLGRGATCHWTLFLLVFFVHFLIQLHSLSLPHLFLLCLSFIMLFLYAFTLMNRQQEHNSIGTAGHQTTHLLGYRHSETVLLRFLFNPILCWNLLCHHRTLPPLKFWTSRTQSMSRSASTA